MKKKTWITLGIIILIIIILIIIIVGKNKKDVVDRDKNNSEIVESLTLNVAGYGDNILDLKYNGNDIYIKLNNNSELPSYVSCSKVPDDLNMSYEISNNNIIDLAKDGTIKTKNIGKTTIIAKSSSNSNIQSNTITVEVVE